MKRITALMLGVLLVIPMGGAAQAESFGTVTAYEVANAIVSNSDRLIPDFCNFSPRPGPVTAQCRGEVDSKTDANNVFVEADFDVIACVFANCLSFPVSLNRTGYSQDVQANDNSGSAPLITVPRICQEDGLCVVPNAIPVPAPDLNNIDISLFGGQDELTLWLPTNDPSNAPAVRVATLTIDNSRDVPTLPSVEIDTP